MALFLDLVRLFTGVTLLAFAAYTDWRWRRAPNALWSIMALVGVLVLSAEAALDWDTFVAGWRNLAFIPVFIVIVYGLWYFGLIAGGADAKALMALGVLLPYPVMLGAPFPLLENPIPSWPLAVSVLGNSLLLFLAVPLSFVFWNLSRGHVRLPHAVLGIKRKAKDVQRGHMWPMEIVDEDGTRRTKLFPSRLAQDEIDALFERVQALGEEKVWVTPKVPFMIPLLLGFVAAFYIGDLMLGLMRLLIPI